MIDKWITRAKKRPIVTVVIAFIVWFIPLAISINANLLARQANEISQFQATPHINATEIFIGTTFSPDSRLGICRHVILLSNRGGVGTAVLSVDTKVRVGSKVVASTSWGTGNDEIVQYYTRFYADSTEAPPLYEIQNTANATSRIQPLYSFLIIPSGETVALALDLEVIAHSSLLASPTIAPGSSSEKTEVSQSDGNISVEYTLNLPDNQQETTTTMGCLTLK